MPGRVRARSIVGTGGRPSARTGSAWRVVSSGGDGGGRGSSSGSSTSSTNPNYSSGCLRARGHTSGTQGSSAVRSKPSKTYPRRDNRVIADTTASDATTTSSSAGAPTAIPRGPPTRELVGLVAAGTSHRRARFTLFAPALPRSRRAPLLRTRGRPLVPAGTAASFPLASAAPLALGAAPVFEFGRWRLWPGRRGWWRASD